METPPITPDNRPEFEETPASGLQQVRSALVGVVLLLGLAALTWQTVTATGPERRPVVMRVLPPVASPAPTPEVWPVTISSAHILYLVGSDEQALAVRAALDDGDRILRQFGRPSVEATIIVVTSDGEAANVLAVLDDGNAVRAGAGLLPITFVDLRDR